MENFVVDDSPIPIFPNEILMKILGKLDTVVLEKVCSRVCIRWKEISETIIDLRLLKMRSTISETTLNEVKLRLAHHSDDDLAILKEYERSYITSQVNIHGTIMETDIFVRRIWKKRACDCEDIAGCLTSVLHWMPCFKLLLVQVPEKICYYHESDPFQLSSIDREIEPYQTEAPVIRVDNNTHAAVSVFHDRVVVQETPRVLMLFQCIKVDHEERSVTVERIRRIFLPLWSCALTLCYNKVFVLFTTGFLGVWHEDSDAIAISDNKCGSAETVKTMRLTTMYRCNELIFIKLWSSPNDISWTIMDSKEIALNLHNVPINSLISAAFSNSINGECSQVSQLSVWNNALIVHCKINEGSNSDHKIIVGRMREDPKREHFLSQQRFQELFHDTCRVRQFSLSGSLTTPFSPILSKDNKQCAVSILAIQKYLTETHRRRRLRLMCVDLVNGE